MQDGSPFDALLPTAMARKAEDVGVAKASLPTARLFTLAVLAGAFVALGAVFATVAATGAQDAIGFGPSRVVAGLVFSLGLVLVVVAGAELFTGNTLLVMAVVARRIGARSLLRNWAIVYAGNLAGAAATAWLVHVAALFRGNGGAVGRQALDIAAAKSALPFDDALARGVLANALVCLAVWLSFSARSVTDKVLAVIFPITAFVAAGFEHSVANMYFLPAALLIKDTAPQPFWDAIGSSATAYPDVTWFDAVVRNLVPVTIGNIIGGAVLVGLVYAFVYPPTGLARRSSDRSDRRSAADTRTN